MKHLTLSNLKKMLVIVLRELVKLKNVMITNKQLTLASIGLFLGFYCLYISIGLLLIPSYQKFDFFGADSVKWYKYDLAQSHKGSHALLLLFVIPLRSLLKILPLSKEVIAVTFNSLFGALAVTLASVFFGILTKKVVDTLIVSIVFGLTMSQIVFSSIPESYAMGTCSIITTYILFIICMNHKKIYFEYWVLAGLFSFGVTITNFTQTVICFTALVFLFKNEEKIVTVLKYVAYVIGLAGLLSLIQKVLFIRGAKIFFLSQSDFKYITNSVFYHPLAIIKEVLKHFFLVNFVSPSPFTEKISVENGHKMLDFFMQPLKYNVIGMVAVIIFITLFAIGFIKNVVLVEKRKFIIPVALAILFNVALHSFFGIDTLFLYTCNVTFPILLLSINESILKMTYYRIGLVWLAIFMGLNNLMIMKQIISD